MPIAVPRHLYHTDVYMRPAMGRICEADDPEAAVLMAPAGTLYAEEDAKRLGIAEYLKSHPVQSAEEAPPEEKAVEQAKTEDKAVAGPDEVKTHEPPAPPDPADDPGQPGDIRIGRPPRRGA